MAPTVPWSRRPRFPCSSTCGRRGAGRAGWSARRLEQLARTRAGKVKLVKVNVDESPQVAGRLGVQGIPTLLVVDRGEVVARQTGAAPEHVLRQWLDEALTKSRLSI